MCRVYDVGGACVGQWVKWVGFVRRVHEVGGACEESA